MSLLAIPSGTGLRSSFLTIATVCFVNAAGFALSTHRQQIGKWVVRVWPGMRASLKTIGVALLWVLGGIAALIVLVSCLEHAIPELLGGWYSASSKGKRHP